MKDAVKLQETDRMIESKLKECNLRLTKEINENNDQFMSAQHDNEKFL